MGKPESQRTHKKSVDAANSRKSASDVRAEKCARSKARNDSRKRKHQEREAELALTRPERRKARIEFLKKNEGGYKRERAKFAKFLA